MSCASKSEKSISSSILEKVKIEEKLYYKYGGENDR